MFTGIIEETGRVLSARRNPAGGAVLEIGAGKIMDDLRIGDSVAVNGVCLTVAALSDAGFSADVTPQTLRMSALGALSAGSAVNLERAMRADGRFGGHIVSGHIDGTGRIESLRREGNSILMRVSAPAEVMRLIVPKGSVAVDGISLTVAAAGKADFTVSLIPHTFSGTALNSKKADDPVNLENDIIGKYVEKLLGSCNGGLSLEFLKENGF